MILQQRNGDAWLILVLDHVCMFWWLFDYGWLLTDWLLMMLVIWGKTPTKIRGNSPQSPRLSARFWMPRNLKPILQYTPCSWEGRCMGSGASSNNLYISHFAAQPLNHICFLMCVLLYNDLLSQTLGRTRSLLGPPKFPNPPNHPPKKSSVSCWTPIVPSMCLQVPIRDWHVEAFRWSLLGWVRVGEGWFHKDGFSRSYDCHENPNLRCASKVFFRWTFSILQIDDWKFLPQNLIFFLCFRHESRSHGMFVCWTSLDCHQVPEIHSWLGLGLH